MSINFTTLATGALAFTVALAWNDAISKIVTNAIPSSNKHTTAGALFLYALVVTIFVIFIAGTINFVRKIAHRNDPSPQGAPTPGGQKTHMLPPILQLWEPPSSGMPYPLYR